MIRRRATLFLASLLMTVCSCSSGKGGAIWPRFPFDPASRSERMLAIVYSTSMLGPRSTLADLGYPGRNIFRLHEEHPRIRVILRSCPASRYSGDRSVLESEGAVASWRALATDPRFDWIEIANQGYTHAPPGDSNIDHHEFSTTQEGCNLDHATLGEAAYVEDRMERIRSTYRELGIPVSLIQFPGLAHSGPALRAALEREFSAVLGKADTHDPYRERWIRAGGAEMPIIPVTKFKAGEALSEGISSGRIAPGDLKDSPEFTKEVEDLFRVVSDAAGGGGILILTDSFSETFQRAGGTYPRYLILDAVLRDAESRYAGAIWYPRGRELALWLRARHHASVDVTGDADRVEARIRLPEGWNAVDGAGLDEASIILPLPSGWDRLGSVRIDEGSGWREIDRSHYWLRREGVAIVFPLGGPVTLQAIRG